MRYNTEGVDVPGIDCVLFADPRRSAVDIVQAVGRALRPAPGKKLGYVIVPILHDADATPDDIFESESFQEILTTLRALAANDDRIIEYFRAVSHGRQRTGGGSVEFDIDECLIPVTAWSVYANKGWAGMGDWLGTGTVAPRLKEYRPFREAVAFARELKLKSQKEWGAFCKGEMPQLGRLPEDIPANPAGTYADKGWKSMGDWLGTGTVATSLKEYRPFHEARAFVHKLKLRSNIEWLAFTKGRLKHVGQLPNDIPAYPNQTYATKGWKGMSDWLGNGRTLQAQWK